MTTTSQIVATPVGDARITYFPAAGRSTPTRGDRAGHPSRPAGRLRAVVVLGHGAGAGVEAPDLQALAMALPEHRVAVALVEQPWRVAGKPVAPAPRRLDQAWIAVWAALDAEGAPLIAGGRSAGARVACRTGRALGAVAVLALSFPLHPPGKPDKSRADELLDAGLPTLVVQGERDPFGGPAELTAAGYRGSLTPVGYADHGFSVPKRAPVDRSQTLEVITGGVSRWLDGLV